MIIKKKSTFIMANILKDFDAWEELHKPSFCFYVNVQRTLVTASTQ